MSTTRLVLFDIDGTLLLTDGAGRESLCEAFEAIFGLSGMDPISRRISYGGRTDPLIVEDLARESGVPAPDLARNSERLFERYLEGLERRLSDRSRTRTLPGVLELLDALADRDEVVLGLLTGNIEGGARTKLRAVDLSDRFAEGGYGSDHSVRSEIARIAREKVERHSGDRFAPEEVAVIGDTRHDVDCARANDYRVVAVATGSEAAERLTDADDVLDDLSDTDRALAALGIV